MGNFVSASKFDIISNLPPELVLEIFSYVSVRETANCSLVSRKWNHTIIHLAPLWTNAAARIVGLSRNAISMVVASFSSPKEFFIAALKHKETVKALNLTPNHIRHSVPEELLFTHCLEAKQELVVRTQKLSQTDNKNCRHELVVDQLTRVHQMSEGIFSDNVAQIPVDKHLKVIWATVTDKHLYWTTTNGLWSCYNLRSKSTVFTWRNPLLKEGQGLTVSRCKDCSMVMVSHWFPTPINSQDYHSTYAIQIIKLGEKSQTPVQLIQWKVIQKNHNHEFFAEHDTRYWSRNAFVLSTSDKTVDGVCHSHKLILQCDCCTMVHPVEARHTVIHNDKHACSIDMEFGKPSCLSCDSNIWYDEGKDVCFRSVSSKVALSSDENLLGQVFNKKLYVWKTKKVNQEEEYFLDESNSSLQLISSAPLVRKHTGTCNSIKLVALGHIVSIVAYIDNSYLLDYKLQIVQTHTGEVLSEFRRIERFYNWSLCCQIDPLHKFYFMHDDDRWLNTIQAPVPSIPLTTVHNHHGKVHMEALQLKKTVMQSWRKHWRCAVNYGLRE